MKFSGILMLVIGLGLGLAVGSYFSPQVQPAEGLLKLPDVGKAPLFASTETDKGPQSPAAEGIPSKTATSKIDVSSISQERDSYRQAKEINDYVNSLRPEDLPRAVHELGLRSDAAAHPTLLALIGRWAEVDPQGALARMHKKGSRVELVLLALDVYGPLAARNPDEALRQARQLPAGQPREYAMMAIVKQVTKDDPVKALEIVEKVGSNQLLAEFSPAIFAQWGAKDIDKATQAALQLPDPKERNQYIQTMANALAQKDPQAAVAWLNQIPAGPAHESAQNGVISTWGYLDPQAAIAWAKNLPDATTRNTLLAGMLSSWSNKDLKGALAEALQFPNGEQKNGLIQGMAVNLAQTDIPGALAAMETLPPSKIKNATRESIISSWIGKDPKAAMDYLNSSVPNGPEKAAILQHILEPLVHIDPKAALVVVQSLSSARKRNDTMTEILTNWTQRDVNAAKAYIETLPEGSVKNRVMFPLISHLASSGDISSAVDMTSKLGPGQVKNDAQISVAFAWARKDLPAATAYGMELPAGNTRNSFLASVADQLSRANPSGMDEWLKKLPDAESLDQVVTHIAPRWVADNMASAKAYAMSMPPGPAQDHLSTEVARQLVGQDPVKALDWVNQLPDSDGRKTALNAVFGQWALGNPATASAYLQAMPDGPTKQSAIPVVVNNWARKDPAAAGQWLNTLPDSPQKATAASNIITNWDKSDPIQAAAWLTQLPAGSPKDEAIKTFSTDTFNADPERAVQWAVSIGDAKAQQAQVTDLLKKWLQKDPTSGTTAVQNSSLPDAVKAKLLQPK